ncbi:uncharacterized protein [Battus philenor]|uniref:uncharacterized protein n=1 Tax=Battus philenor TaxID=42288 RepID=UPI0035D09F7C
MKFSSSIIVLGLLILIPNGLSIPEKENATIKNISNKENNSTAEISSKKPDEVKPDSKVESKTKSTTKPKKEEAVEDLEETQTDNMSVEPEIDDGDNQMYYMIPAPHKPAPKLKPKQPFNIFPNNFQWFPTQHTFKFDQNTFTMPFPSDPIKFQQLSPWNPITMPHNRDPVLEDGTQDSGAPVYFMQKPRPSKIKIDHSKRYPPKFAIPEQNQPYSWYGGVVPSYFFPQ